MSISSRKFFIETVHATYYLVGKLKILLVTLSYFLTGVAVVAKYVENEKAPNKNLKKKGMLKLKKIGFDKG